MFTTTVAEPNQPHADGEHVGGHMTPKKLVLFSTPLLYATDCH
jgi:hypothetical protein